MKFVKSIIKCLVAAALLTGAGMMTSCDDQPYKYSSTSGSPEVHFIRLAGNSAADSVIVGANPGTQICIVGDNLRSIHELYFNDRKAVLNTSYITDHTLLVEIPSSLPVRNTKTIYMVNGAGETTEHHFEVYGIKPAVKSLSAEYAKPGQIATIYGSYFVQDDNEPLRVTIGDNDAEVIEYTDNSITFRVPDYEGKARIAVTSVYGTGYASFTMRDETGVMFNDWGKWDAGDRSTGLGNHGWHDMLIKSDEWSIAGAYLQLGDEGVTMAADGGWNDGAFSFEYWPGDWNTPTQFNGTDKHLSDLFDVNNVDNMALKFEMCIPKSNPWMAGHMQVIFSGDDDVSCNNPKCEAGGFNNVFFHREKPILPRAIYAPWEATGSFDTNDEWITVTLPVASSFIYDYYGVTVAERLSKEQYTGLTIFVVDFADANDTRIMKEGTDCQPIIKIDNVRMVEYK